MKRKPLYMNRHDDDEGRYLSTDDDADDSRPATDADITLEALADLMDQDAESCNAHDFVLTHRALAALLHQEIGRDAATKVFRRLVDFDGLHGMTGVAGAGEPKEAEKALGVPLGSWADWKLPDTTRGA